MEIGVTEIRLLMIGMPYSFADVLANGDKVLRIAANFIIDTSTGLVGIRGDTVEQRNPHRNGTDIQMLVLDHIDGFRISCVSIIAKRSSPFFRFYAWS